MNSKQMCLLFIIPAFLSFFILCDNNFSIAAEHEENQSSWEYFNAAGERAFNRNEIDKAGKLLQKALEIAESFGEKDPRLARSLHNTGFINYKAGNLKAAEPFLQRAIKVKENIYGKNHGEIAWSLLAIGDLYRDSGKYTEAETCLKRSIQIYSDLRGKHSPSVAGSMHDLAISYAMQGDMDNSRKYFLDALSIWEKTLGKNHHEYQDSLSAYKKYFREEPSVYQNDSEEIKILFSEIEDPLMAVAAIKNLKIARAISMDNKSINLLIKPGSITKTQLLKTISDNKSKTR